MVFDEFEEADVVAIWSILVEYMDGDELHSQLREYAGRLELPEDFREFYKLSDLRWQGLYPATLVITLHDVLKPYGLANAILPEDAVYVRTDAWQRLTRQALLWCPLAELGERLLSNCLESDLGL